MSDVTGIRLGQMKAAPPVPSTPFPARTVLMMIEFTGDFSVKIRRSRVIGPIVLNSCLSIAIMRTFKKKAELLALGVDHVIANGEEDLAARSTRLRPVKERGLCSIPLPARVWKILAAAENGIIFEYGALATEPTPYPPFAALRKHLTIKGYTLFDVVGNPAAFPKAKQYVFDRIAAGDFKPRIDRTFPLSQIVEAHRYMESNAQIGKIVVTI